MCCLFLLRVFSFSLMKQTENSAVRSPSCFDPSAKRELNPYTRRAAMEIQCTRSATETTVRTTGHTRRFVQTCVFKSHPGHSQRKYIRYVGKLVFQARGSSRDFIREDKRLLYLGVSPVPHSEAGKQVPDHSVCLQQHTWKEKAAKASDPIIIQSLQKGFIIVLFL